MALKYPSSSGYQKVLQDDIYFRGTTKHPVWLYNEWARDIDNYIKQNNDLPNLTLVRLHMFHFGAFDQTVAGLLSSNG